MDNVIKQLTEMKIGKVLEQEPLANHTTMKIGGRLIYSSCRHPLKI